MKKIMKITAAAMAAALLGTSAYAAPDNIENIAIGSDRSEIRAALGEPADISINGMKEIYLLNGDSFAVLIYGSDSLQHGYIVE